MTIQQIAHRLTELSRKGEFEKAHHELFSPEIVTIEPEKSHIPVMKGLDALKQKSRQFNDMIQEVHGIRVSEPVIEGNFFTIGLGMDVTQKDGKRTNMDEICVYEVKGGKIVQEIFHY